MSGAPIAATDRVADVLARDERLVDVFVAVSPAFERLRSPGLRRVMARLVTVEQAARVARVEPAVLLDRLNHAIADPGRHDAAPEPNESTMPGTDPSAPRPEALSAIPEDRVVELDVRDALRNGEEPFSRIMAARREVADDGALRLRAIFEPVPLYAVMARQGFEHWTEQLDADDWVIWFYRDPADADADAAAGAEPGQEPAGPESAGQEEAAGEAGDDVVVLDVRGLEPPEPMVRTLAALDALPVGSTLVQINVREPRFLLPQLAERGFVYEVREQAEDLVRVFIRHAEGD